jgi:hypothetical protein
VAPSTPPKTPAAPRKAAGCDPPYVIDANGIQRFKPECFR